MWYRKILWTHTCFILIVTLFDDALSIAMLRNFEVMLGQTLNHSVEFRNFG
jgi:hypothetical protein